MKVQYQWVLLDILGINAGKRHTDNCQYWSGHLGAQRENQYPLGHLQGYTFLCRKKLAENQTRIYVCSAFQCSVLPVVWLYKGTEEDMGLCEKQWDPQALESSTEKFLVFELPQLLCSFFAVMDLENSHCRRESGRSEEKSLVNTHSYGDSSSTPIPTPFMPLVHWDGRYEAVLGGESIHTLHTKRARDVYTGHQPNLNRSDFFRGGC